MVPLRRMQHMVRTSVLPVLRSLRSVYPFTWAGSIAALLAVILSLRGYGYSSSGELLIGLIMLCTLAALAGAVRMERRRREGSVGELSCPPVIQANSELPLAELSADERATPMFLRLHLQLKGRLCLGGDAVIRVSAEASGLGDSPIEVILPLPLAGVLQAELRATVRDFFGLCSIEIVGDVHRKVAVLPPRYPVHREYSLSRLSGNENRKLVRNADEERYHMREYAPGDRVRDINWKASSRLPILLTRVSPESQEESTILPILLLRGGGGGGTVSRGGETPQSVAERSHRLSWLLYFLAGILDGEKSVTVQLLVTDRPEDNGGGGVTGSFFELTDTDELHEQAGRIVVAATASSDRSATSNDHSLQKAFHPADIEGLCVFASAADPAYHSLTRLRNMRETRYFLTRQALADGAHNDGIDITVLPDIDIDAFPDRWVFRRSALQSADAVATGDGSYESDYVRARLLRPGGGGPHDNGSREREKGQRGGGLSMIRRAAHD
ncbi:MAG: DUF58 domain-containing protein [Spirochaetaceae bacterium]|nr:MAG: DUF58 domain-containing protein [Spirochaetaceae bacterium]